MSPKRSGSATGGPRADMRETLQRPLAFVSHADASFMARRAEFRDLIAAMAESLRPYAQGLEEQRIIQDAKRARLSIHGLEVLCRIAARSERPFAVENTMRSAVIGFIAHPAQPCPFDASKLEEQTNGPLNEAQILAHEEKTPVRWEAVAELSQHQAFASQALADAAGLFARRAS